MFSKILAFITCLFITCAPESSEAGKFVVIPDNEQVQTYVEPKNYKETGKNPYSCTEKYYAPTITGTGTEAKKAYKNYGECRLTIHNEQAMPKDIACQQKDGKINYKLKFQWDFSNGKYFIEAGNGGFYKFDNKLYFTIYEIGFEVDGPSSNNLFGYDCLTKKISQIKIPVLISYWSITAKNILSLKEKILLEIGGGNFRGSRPPFSIGIFDKNIGKVDQLFLFDKSIYEGGYGKVTSSFTGSEIIPQKITQYINDYGVGNYMEKYSNKVEYGVDSRTEYLAFAKFTLESFDKNLKGKLVVTMPGFKAIFNIDLKKKKIWW